MTQNCLLPARRESSPAVALLSQRLPKYGDTVGKVDMEAGTPFGAVAIVTFCVGWLGIAYGSISLGIWVWNAVAGAFGGIGLFCLAITYTTVAILKFKSKIFPSKKVNVVKRLGYLLLGPLVTIPNVMMNELFGSWVDWIDDQIENYCAKRRWKDPRQALLDAFQKHQKHYCQVFAKKSDEKDLRSKIENWKSWWRSIEQSKQEGADMSEWAELALQMREDLQSSIICKADEFELSAQKLFDVAQFQVTQIQQARMILTEPDDLEKLVEVMKLAEAKLSEAANALKLIAEARSLALCLPELQYIIQVADNKQYLERCERAQNKLVTLIRQAEQVENDRLS
jgi:hypothetical protein